MRHPLDIMLSVFSNHLTHGFYCAYALETAARHYVLVMELVEHYRGQMTLRYLPIRYEDIVADQEASSAPHARFHRRAVRRALPRVSREPALCPHRQLCPGDRAALRPLALSLPRTIVKQLEPVIPILEPVIERLGYPIA